MTIYLYLSICLIGTILQIQVIVNANRQLCGSPSFLVGEQVTRPAYGQSRSMILANKKSLFPTFTCTLTLGAQFRVALRPWQQVAS